MDRPLWQIVLSILLLSYAVQRAGAAAIGFGGAMPRELAVASAIEAGFAVVAAIGLWIGGRWAGITIVALGVAVAAHAAMLVFVLGAAAVPAAASRILIVALGAGAFFWILRHELTPGSDPDARPRGTEHASRGRDL
jgi:hypothetical protein